MTEDRTPTEREPDRFCQECGTEGHGRLRFCGKCGASLTGGERHPNSLQARSTATQANVALSPALTNPITLQGRTAPLDVWIFVGAAWLGALLFAILGFLVVRPSLELLGDASAYGFFFAVYIALAGAMALAYGGLLAWLGFQVLEGDATAPWLGVAAGGVLLIGTTITLISTQSLGSYALLTVLLMLVSAALVGLGAFSPGLRAHCGNDTGHPPLTTAVAAGVSRWILFLFAVNGVAALAYFFASVAGSYTQVKLLLLGLILTIAAALVFWATRTILDGDPNARVVLTGASAVAALAYLFLNESFGSGAWFGWIQVCLAVTTIVLLWLPTSSTFFRGNSGGSS